MQHDHLQKKIVLTFVPITGTLVNVYVALPVCTRIAGTS